MPARKEKIHFASVLKNIFVLFPIQIEGYLNIAVWLWRRERERELECASMRWAAIGCAHGRMRNCVSRVCVCDAVSVPKGYFCSLCGVQLKWTIGSAALLPVQQHETTDHQLKTWRNLDSTTTSLLKFGQRWCKLLALSLKRSWKSTADQNEGPQVEPDRPVAWTTTWKRQHNAFSWTVHCHRCISTFHKSAIQTKGQNKGGE